MDSFLSACGAQAPLVLEIEGPGHYGIERRSYPQPFVIIGRDERADLLLDHDLVSRRHAYLQVIDGRLFFVDLDSRSGTFYAGNAAESGWLSPGDALTIGPYTLRVQVPDPNDDPDSGFEFRANPIGQEGMPLNPLLARSSETVNLPRVSLEFQSRTAGHSVWRMSQVLALVGSSPRCKVRLLDSNVSKLHCALLRTTRGLWVIDLLGRGGITVSGATVRFASLAGDDVLGLGQVVVRPNFTDSHTQGRSPSGATGVWNTTPPGAGLPATTPRPWGPPASQSPSAPAYLTPARPPGVTELAGSDPGMSLLLNHFGTMQQQMLDQFQSSMMMMLQMFNTMHKDQMGLVREELDRLRELGDEVQQIKAQMAVAPPQQPQAPTPPQAIAPWQGNVWPPPQRPAPPPNGPHPKPDHPRGVNGSAPGTPNPFAARPQAWPPNAASPSVPSQGPPKPPAEDDGVVHDWLNDRLAAITAEQQTRFQKIMGILKSNK